MKDNKEISVRIAEGFAQTPFSLFEDARLKAHDKLCYTVLKTYWPTCYASYATIALKMSCSKRQAILSIHVLENLGYISKEVEERKKVITVYNAPVHVGNKVVNDMHQPSEPSAPKVDKLNRESKQIVGKAKHPAQDSFWKHIQRTSKERDLPAIWPKFKWFRDALTDCLESMGLEKSCKHWDNFLDDPWITNKSVQVFMKDPGKWANVRKKFTDEVADQTPRGDDIDCHHEMDWSKAEERGMGQFFGPCKHCEANIHRTKEGRF